MVVLQSGFRPFFLLAGFYGVIVTLLWFCMHILHWPMTPSSLSIFAWHAHEMIFGYSLAVVSGFMLTAVPNWTGKQTLIGWPLAVLCLLWILARCLYFLEFPTDLPLSFAIESLFFIFLLSALVVPIVKVRYYRSLPLLVILLLLFAANSLFHYGLNKNYYPALATGIYLGLYVLMGLILVVGRRVIPFFIEKGLSRSAPVSNSAWVDRLVLTLYVLFVVFELLRPDPLVITSLSLALALVLSIRLSGWYRSGILNHPLLWILFAGYGSLVPGFLLKALAAIDTVNPFLALHAFAYGAIGLTTLGMMARVSWGHTGRDVRRPDGRLKGSFALLLLGMLIRVFLPLVFPQGYTIWIVLSQLCWVLAFLVFLTVFGPILLRPRVEN